jgi:hypothetical protein
MKKADSTNHYCSAISKLITEGGAKLKPSEEHAGITSDMTGRWTINAFDTSKANKDETPVIKEDLIPDPKPVLAVDEPTKTAYICAWCDKDENITKAYHRRGYDTSHGICKHCFELMKKDMKEHGVIKLKPLLTEEESDENPTWPDIGDVDKDFEKGETNFPHGHGHPNVNSKYDKVVQLNSIYGVDEATMQKYNNVYSQKIKAYVNQHLPWIKHYFKEDNYAEQNEVWGVESAVRRVIDNFKHWAYETEDNITRPGAERWWYEMFKRAQAIIVANPTVMKEIENYEKFLEFVDDESPENPDNQKNYPLHVSLYDVTRALGGHEEGGWWYDNPEMIKTVKVTNLAQAEKAAKALYNEISQADLDGQPHICLEKTPGARHGPAPTYS